MSEKPARNYSHVLFDMDGLLLDTVELYSKSYQAINDRHGGGQEYTFTFKVKWLKCQTLEVTLGGFDPRYDLIEDHVAPC